MHKMMLYDSLQRISVVSPKECRDRTNSLDRHVRGGHNKSKSLLLRLRLLLLLQLCWPVGAVQGVGALVALSVLSFSSSSFLFLPLCFFGLTLGLSDPVFIPSLFGRSSGCSPDSAPSFGAVHAGSFINSDPPCSLPPRHVPVRYIVAFTHSSIVFFFSVLSKASFFSLLLHALLALLSLLPRSPLAPFSFPLL